MNTQHENWLDELFDNKRKRGKIFMCKLYPIELILLFEMIGYEDGAVNASL